MRSAISAVIGEAFGVMKAYLGACAFGGSWCMCPAPLWHVVRQHHGSQNEKITNDRMAGSVQCGSPDQDELEAGTEAVTEASSQN